MGFEPQAWSSENEALNKFVDQMKMAQEEAKAALAKAKCHDPLPTAGTQHQLQDSHMPKPALKHPGPKPLHNQLLFTTTAATLDAISAPAQS
ncbi:hypothetical protein C0993_009246 [Termitomyces sp. T159_Od127]|nr:hypothetical protein C0993_009246 [Termitomyces sp. T159_Od127]